VIARAEQIRASQVYRPEIDCVWLALSEDTSEAAAKSGEVRDGWLSFVDAIPGLFSAMTVETRYAD
jgi:hypothetical protein